MKDDPSSTPLGRHTLLGRTEIISPLFSGEVRPSIVEYHEALHQELIDTSGLGVLARLIAVAHERCNEAWFDGVRDRMKLTLQAIQVNSFKVHESVATFLSLVALENNDLLEAERMRNELTPQYRELDYLLTHATKHLVFSSPLERDMVLYPVIMSIGVAMLSPSGLLLAEDFENLRLMPGHIALNSPDTRFTIFLQELDPSELELLCEQCRELWMQALGQHTWDLSLQSRPRKLHEIGVSGDFVEHYHPIVLAMTGKVDILANAMDLPTTARQNAVYRQATRVLLSWKRDFGMMGITGLDDIDEIAIPEMLSTRDALSYRYVMPGKGPEKFDRSLAYRFNTISFKHFRCVLTLASLADAYTYIHLSVKQEADILQVTALGTLYPARSFTNDDGVVNRTIDDWGERFSCVMDLEQWLSLAHVFSPDKIGLKFFSRAFADNGLAAAISVPTFRVNMIQDTSVNDLAMWIDVLLSVQQEVHATLINLGQRGSYAFVVNGTDSSEPFICIGMTSIRIWKCLSQEVFAGDKRVHFEVTHDDPSLPGSIVARLGLDQARCVALLWTSYTPVDERLPDASPGNC